MSKIQETHDELKVEHDQLAEAKKATTKKKVAKTAKPAEKKAAKPAKGARKGVAMEHIRAALKSAKAPTALQALATDAPSKMALSQLQKGINELASAKREKEQGEAASQLSSINRIVRRMLRAMK